MKTFRNCELRFYRVSVSRTFGRILLPLPDGREACVALRTLERFRRRRSLVVFCDEVYHVLESQQVNELSVGRIGDEMHLWWRGFWWWNLQKQKKAHLTNIC